MRKTVKHAHTHGHEHTLQPSTGTLNFSIRTLQVYVVLLTFFFIDVFFYWVHTTAVHCAWVCGYGCMQVTSVPSEVLLILHSKGSHEQSSSACQHGASLTFGVLLKVLMEGTLRGLCPLQPSCGSVSSLLTACFRTLKTACICDTVESGQWHLDGSPGLVCESAVFKKKWNLDAVISCVFDHWS